MYIAIHINIYIYICKFTLVGCRASPAASFRAPRPAKGSRMTNFRLSRERRAARGTFFRWARQRIGLRLGLTWCGEFGAATQPEERGKKKKKGWLYVYVFMHVCPRIGSGLGLAQRDEFGAEIQPKEREATEQTKVGYMFMYLCM